MSHFFLQNRKIEVYNRSNYTFIQPTGGGIISLTKTKRDDVHPTSIKEEETYVK